MDNTEKAKVISKKIFDTAMDRTGTLLDNKTPVYRRPCWKVYFCRNAVPNVPNWVVVYTCQDKLEVAIKNATNLNVVSENLKWFSNDSSNRIEYAKDESSSSKSKGPIILLLLDNNRYVTLDGNHRVNDAIKEGKKSILAYEIDANFLINNDLFLTKYDKKICELWQELKKVVKNK